MTIFPSIKDVASAENFGDIDYQPWGMLFVRDHRLTCVADEMGLMINCGDVSCLRPYFAILRQMLINIQPLFKPQNIARWFQEINEYENELENWEQEKAMGLETDPRELIKKLRWFHRKLLFTKQYIGYGVPRKQRHSTKDDIKRALLGE